MDFGCVDSPHLRGRSLRWRSMQYRAVNMHTGQLASSNVDSLSAFFPGLQALMGDVESWA